VPIDQENKAISSLAFGSAVLRRGGNLVWFPEGSRSVTGQLQPFRPGIGMILARYPVTVVSAAIMGTYESLPVGTLWPHFRPIIVIFGPPLQLQALVSDGKERSAEERIVHELEDAVAKLLAEAEREKIQK
jgi:long-chain acyl-CoA synthetase